MHEDLMSIPKSLRSLIENDDRLRKTCDDERADRNGFWLYLAPGWNWDGCHSIHEMTVRECKDALSRVTKCESGCDCGWDKPHHS